jgi:hypothetical protein
MQLSYKNAKSDYKLSDVPDLLERDGWVGLLGARAALLDAAEEVLNTAASEQRALKADEQRSFDEYSAQVRDINGRLAEYKAAHPQYDRLPF